MTMVVICDPVWGISLLYFSKTGLVVILNELVWDATSELYRLYCARRSSLLWHRAQMQPSSLQDCHQKVSHCLYISSRPPRKSSQTPLNCEVSSLTVWLHSCLYGGGQIYNGSIEGLDDSCQLITSSP